MSDIEPNADAVALERITDPYVLECLHSPAVTPPVSSEGQQTLSAAELLALFKKANPPS